MRNWLALKQLRRPAYQSPLLPILQLNRWSHSKSATSQERRSERLAARGRERAKGGKTTVPRIFGGLTKISSIPQSSTFSQTMQFITGMKLQELEKQTVAYNEYAMVLDAANATQDLSKKVDILLKGVRAWTGSGAVDDTTVVGGKFQLADLEVWLAQSKKDASFSPKTLKHWASILETHIHHSRVKFEHAKLCGKLLDEWFSSEDCGAAKGSKEGGKANTTEFIEIGRKEMQEQKEKFASIIFEPKDVNTDALTAYLSELFSDKAASEALKDLREDIEEFSSYLEWKPLTPKDVLQIIRSLIASNLMGEEEIESLRQFKDSPLVLDEVASVLNMRLANLSQWSWPESGLCVEARRHLNGKYRMFTNPDIIDALLLEYVGVGWQRKFLEVFRALAENKKAWKPSVPPLTKEQLDRRNLFLKETNCVMNIEEFRRTCRMSAFFLRNLARNDYNPSGEEPTMREKLATNEHLLHLLSMDCELNKLLKGRHAILCTDLEWFGPSLPHASILTLLKFFGVSEKWLGFFRTWLRAPLRFSDDPLNEIRVRQRGTPISYALSNVFGEIVLFVMDLAVNQRADGLYLYRIHDDLWMWDADPERCAKAWREVQRYASLVGLTFNEAKTGAVCVGGARPLGLPTGAVRWNFLLFDAEKEARFVIDQEMVSTHIEELRRQLAATKSVLGWVNAYNRYMRFLLRNCGGTPAVYYGVERVDEMIGTFARIQRELFPRGGGAIGYLRERLASQFGIVDIPQGFFYFALASGSLEVYDPFIELFAVRPEIEEIMEEQTLKKTEELDELDYREAKEKWETTADRYTPGTPTEFMTFDEYILGRETRMPNWHKIYLDLRAITTPRDVALPPAVEAILDRDKSAWHRLSHYQKSVVCMFGEEMAQKFGGLEAVDPSLIPLGMVQLFKNTRTKWDQ